MRRLFWLSVGAGAGVYATRRVNRFTRQWTPENVAARAGEKLVLFARDVRWQTRAREAQLREALEHDRLGPVRTGSGAGGGDRARQVLTRAALPPAAEPRPALTEGAGSAGRSRRALSPPRPERPERPVGSERGRALPEATPRRVLKAHYTIIDNDKDGH